MKNNKIILTLILVLTIGIVGLTIAYFANSSTINNIFNTNPYGTTVTEEFVSSDNWLPGTSTDKSLTVTNTGQVDEAVRISYTESWTSRSAKNNNEEGDLPLQQNGNTAALIHFTNTDDWTTVTENGTTYRYYNYKLAPSSTTSELLDYVTFNPAITNSSNCIETPTATGKTITCNSTGEGYDDATYKLTFYIETIQYDKYKTAWGTNVNIASMKPMNATQLALKSNPVSITNYTDGNVHEMYTFNHEATEQTPALTDYRYIGDDPYNYVYFNCDSLDNQNSDTCEVWRIIGVFDVERPDPNDNTQTITERRMKLVRGSAFSEITRFGVSDAFNSYNSNDWTTSTLKDFLNENYYLSSEEELTYGLRLSVRNMIEDSIFYLGGIDYQNYNGANYGDTIEIYKWERGTDVFNQDIHYYDICNGYLSTNFCKARMISWSGKIALLYPSDVYMTYSNNVDNICYNNPNDCNRFYYDWDNVNNISILKEKQNPGSPEKSWIYNSNIRDGQSMISDIWLLSSASSNAETSFYISNLGKLGPANWMSGVRPTLYLSSSVKIIDGDGSINNPYKLSL